VCLLVSCSQANTLIALGINFKYLALSASFVSTNVMLSRLWWVSQNSERMPWHRGGAYLVHGDFGKDQPVVDVPEETQEGLGGELVEAKIGQGDIVVQREECLVGMHAQSE